MTVSVGRIVIVEYPGVFAGAKPGIVTQVWHSNSVDVTVFGASPVRGLGTFEFREVKFFEAIEDAHNVAEPQGAFAYYPRRVESTPNVLVDPNQPTAVSGDVVQRILDLAKENQRE